MNSGELAQCRLVVIGGGGEGEQFPLSGESMTVGRLYTNDICLSWDRRVSRAHATLVRQNGVWILEDAGSLNGTFIETTRIVEPIELQPGARVRMGRIWLAMVFDEPAMTEPTFAAEEDIDVAEAIAEEPVDFAPVEEPIAETPQQGPMATLLGVLKRPQRGIAETSGDEPEPAVDAGDVSLQDGALLLDIRVTIADTESTDGIDLVRSALAEMETPVGVRAQLRETLGSSDVCISLTTPAGEQGELLVFAGQVVAKLSKMEAYESVVVEPATGE